MHVRPAILRNSFGTNPHQHHHGEGQNETAPRVAQFEASKGKGTERKRTLQQDRVPDDEGRFVRTGLADHEAPGERHAPEHHRFEARGISERKNETRQDTDRLCRCLHDQTGGDWREIPQGRFWLVGRGLERHGAAEGQHRLSRRPQTEIEQH
jgi:hypothetical protein